MVFDGHANGTSRDSTPPPEAGTPNPASNPNASSSSTGTGASHHHHAGGGGGSSNSQNLSAAMAAAAVPVVVSCSAAVDDGFEVDADNVGLSDDEQQPAGESCTRCRASTSARVRLDPVAPRLRTIDHEAHHASDSDEKDSDEEDTGARAAPFVNASAAAAAAVSSTTAAEERPVAARRVKCAPKPKISSGRAKPQTPPPAAMSAPAQVEFVAAKAMPPPIGHDDGDFGDGTVTEAAEAEAAAGTESRLVCCYFRQRGECKMGDKCWYSHDDDGVTPCHYGALCKAGHAPLARNPLRGPSSSASPAKHRRTQQTAAASPPAPYEAAPIDYYPEEAGYDHAEHGVEIDDAMMTAVPDPYAAAADFDPRYDPATFGVLPEPTLPISVGFPGVAFPAAAVMMMPTVAAPRVSLPLVPLPQVRVAGLPPVQLPGLQRTPYRTPDAPELAFAHHQHQAMAHNAAAASALLQLQLEQQAHMLQAMQREQQQKQHQQRSRRFVPSDMPCAYCGNSGCVFTQEFPVYNGNNMTIGHRAHCRTCSRTYAL